MKTYITGKKTPITKWYRGELDEEFIKLENKINKLLKDVTEKYRVQISVNPIDISQQIELTFIINNDESIF